MSLDKFWEYEPRLESDGRTRGRYGTAPFGILTIDGTGYECYWAATRNNIAVHFFNEKLEFPIKTNGWGDIAYKVRQELYKQKQL